MALASMCFHDLKDCHWDNGTQISMVIFFFIFTFILTVYQEHTNLEWHVTCNAGWKLNVGHLLKTKV